MKLRILEKQNGFQVLQYAYTGVKEIAGHHIGWEMWKAVPVVAESVHEESEAALVFQVLTNIVEIGAAESEKKIQLESKSWQSASCLANFVKQLPQPKTDFIE